MHALPRKVDSEKWDFGVKKVGAPLSSFNSKNPLFFKNAFPPTIKQIRQFSGVYKAKDFLEGRVPDYKPREKNVIREILQDHFSLFEESYDTQYSKKYGKYRITHIKESVEKFIECGDYSKGIARIKCTNHDCKYEYFRPFSCKSWYLCPSCNQKRLLLFSEHLSENVLLKLPHRQFVFTLPKLLRVYFKYD